jgi:membrane-bound lytic murein transglycosylase D
VSAVVALLLVVGFLALPVPTAMSTAPPRAMEIVQTALVAPAIEMAKASPIAALARPPLPAITWDLPVTRNKRVDFWIRWLSRTNRERTALWLARSGRYGPMAREKLRERGMPEDLTYLALIESGFSSAATSVAQAAGMWQFIEETGRRYGLKVTPYVDERRDPVKSTDAALRYLQDLHGRFGSWYLAAAAYNSGENRVERLLRQHAGNARGDETLYWKISPHLPRETQDYVPLMLAAGHIGKEPRRYGFRKVRYQAPLAYDTVRAPGGTRLHVIARAIGTPEDAVVELNQHYVRRMTPPGRKHADVRIPEGRSPAFEANFARTLRETTQAP